MNNLQERLLDWLWSRLESPEEEVVLAALALSPSFGDLAEELGRYDERTQEERRQLARVQEDLEQAGVLLEAYHEKVLHLTETAAPPEKCLEELVALIASTVTVHGFQLLHREPDRWGPATAGVPSLALDLFLAGNEANTRLRQCLAESRPILVAFRAHSQGQVIQFPTSLLLLPMVLTGGAQGALALDCGRHVPGDSLTRLTALVRVLNQSRNSEIRLERLLNQVLQLRNRLDGTSTPVVCLDADGVVCEANAAADLLLGEELLDLGQRLRDLPVPGRSRLTTGDGRTLELELHPLPEREVLALLWPQAEGTEPSNLE